MKNIKNPIKKTKQSKNLLIIVSHILIFGFYFYGFIWIPFVEEADKGNLGTLLIAPIFFFFFFIHSLTLLMLGMKEKNALPYFISLAIIILSITTFFMLVFGSPTPL